MELFNLLTNEDLKQASILIYANKQDVPGAMDAGEITRKMCLNEIKEHEWHIQVTISYIKSAIASLLLGLQRKGRQRTTRGTGLAH